jgi:hypothetical protein
MGARRYLWNHAAEPRMSVMLPQNLLSQHPPLPV